MHTSFPILIGWTSPRMTESYHTEEFSPIDTLPITLAVDAMKEQFNEGERFLYDMLFREGCTKLIVRYYTL